MTSPHRLLFVLSSVLCLAGINIAVAEPIDFNEISLLVRARESEPSIVNEVSQRKLVRPLTAQQETTLKTQGAAESLIQALRVPARALAQNEAAAFEARREQSRTGQAGRAAHANVMNDNDGGSEDLQIFEVSVGHPVNLSQWGGPDYEFSFNGKTRLDEGREDAVLVDNVRSFTHVATYLGAGRPDDGTTIFDRRNYVSVMDHSFTRGIRIDHRNPVQVKGVPYTLYPVYAAGGVSLYYINSSTNWVKLAVRTAGR